MSETKPASDGTYWRSRRQHAADSDVLSEQAPEFPGDPAATPPADEVTRREFLGVTGASLALASLSGGCILRKPVETILPYAKRPEDLIPGNPRYFATSARIGGSVQGLLVESQDGRPTKIEGNPQHPGSGGATNAWAQAEVLELYDQDRSRGVIKDGASSSLAAAKDLLSGLTANGGNGVAILMGSRPSPTIRRLLAQLKQRAPAVRLHVHDPAVPQSIRDGARLAGLPDTVAFAPTLDTAQVIVSLDADFLGVDGDVVRHSKAYAKGRRIEGPISKMNRLYCVEPGFSTTGAAADHRLRLQASRIADLARLLVQALQSKGLSGPGVGAVARAATGAMLGEAERRWAEAVADDLWAHRGSSLLLAGGGQPPVVHALAHFLNSVLGNVGLSASYRSEPDAVPAGGLGDLVESLRAGDVETLVIVGANPVQASPAGFDFGNLLAGVATTVHHGLHRDETGAACQWHLPATHFLEAWGDWQGEDGTVSMQQPLIAPLYEGLSEIEVFGLLAGAGAATGHELVLETWKGELGGNGAGGATWQRWLHDGVGPSGRSSPVRPTFDWRGLVRAVGASSTGGDGLEAVFALDACLFDGRYANNAWMQELPDPMTKLAWQGVVSLSPRTAAALSVSDGDVVDVTVDGRTASGPARVAPGLADDTAYLSLGHGRGAAAGAVAAEATGIDAYRVQPNLSGFAHGVTVTRTGRREDLITTQEHGTLVEPGTHVERKSIFREATLGQYRADPAFVDQYDVLPPDKIKSLNPEPNERGGQQWGMSIDLNACTGCNACAVACQAENNVPVVGPEETAKGREMHWIRLDRYYRGDEEDPRAVHQPIPCMHCENAPCETVCPVAATAHGPEGLNDMAYNRCIGTRYCANNCPYKVRRFNFHNYTKANHAERPLATAQRNPDVTVRFRGVMEKCTYCVQRINSAKIDAKVSGSGVVPDGAIVPACAQTCPTQAITFGDINDPNSAVSQAKGQQRDYGLLTELNTKPRTTFLARLRNPNPALEPEEPSAPAAEHH